MKCLTMQVDRQFVSGMGITPGMIYIKDHRPSTPIEGIAIPSETRKLRLDEDNLVNVSSELIRTGLGNGHVRFEGNMLIVLRASIRVGKDGFFELVPERLDDTSGALAYFDVGSGGYSTVEYITDPLETIARGIPAYLPLVGNDSVILTALKPGSYVLVRRSSKRWIFFGESIVKESLSYHFDGKTLSLQDLPQA